MPEHNVVVIGASAGGVSALRRLLATLPHHLNAAVFVVLHRSPFERCFGSDPFAALLEQGSNLPVCEAEDFQRFQASRVYVCPPDLHLLVENGIVRLEHGPTEARARPSIDVLFRSAAVSYGRRAIGVLLTDMLCDGTSGLWEIKKRGGVVIVQDPGEAEYPDMPQSAINNGLADYVLPLAGIAEKIFDLTFRNAVRDHSRQPIKVLIVEDEAVVASNLRAGLKSFGYEIVGVTESGEEAAIIAAGTTPDLVLMDIGLPGSITGVEAARTIWERLQIPVVYLTAYTDLETLDQVKATENYGYVVKPVLLEAVRAAVELAIDRRQKERRTGFS